jgi:hypothetical protein
VPFITFNKEYNRADDGTIIGSTFNVTLEGTVTPVLIGAEVNITAVDDLQDEIREIFNKDGMRLELKCGSDVLLKAFPRINSIEFGPENTHWVQKSPYTINLEFDEDESLNEEDHTGGDYVKSASESWGVEFDDGKNFHSWNIGGSDDVLPYVVRITHNVSAVGKRHYEENGPLAFHSGAIEREAWEQAREYVVPRLGFDATKLECSGTFNLDGSLFSVFNHLRNCNIDELGGAYSVTETWLGVPTGVNGVIDAGLEDFNINVRNSTDNGLTNVSIDGTIIGLEERNYGTEPSGFAIGRSKKHMRVREIILLKIVEILILFR